MRFFSNYRLPFRPLLSGVLLLLGVAATGCHSGRVAYQFQPAPAPAAPLVPSVVPSNAESRTLTTNDLAAAPAARAAALLRPRRLARVRRQLARVAAEPSGLRFRVVGPARAMVAARRHRAGPQTTAEAGLGTTVLGVLGLVVLPIGLIGLLLGGGLVWAVLAAAGALAVLVAWLDPFG